MTGATAQTVWTVFIVSQIITCAGAAIGLILTKQYALAWTWACYSLANVGWMLGLQK